MFNRIFNFIKIVVLGYNLMYLKYLKDFFILCNSYLFLIKCLLKIISVMYNKFKH